MRKTPVLFMLMCFVVIRRHCMGAIEPEAGTLGDDQHHDLAEVAHASGNDDARRWKFTFWRRSTHNTGLSYKGNDRQVRHSAPAEPQQSMPDEQYREEGEWHVGGLGLQRHDGR